ncbi:hypothetical protein PAEPH01_2022 [Pancytospora epiphaga]|nr:hypothetical protein PAEPH01_2022 [Pancytospora epiphaga]
MIDGDTRQRLLEKFKKNIDDIIQRYKHIDDTYDSIINLSRSDEMDTMELQEVSFIKKGRKITRSTNTSPSFDEIYFHLCGKNDFEDILNRLCWNTFRH